VTAVFANYYIPGLNVAFLFSIALTVVMTLVIIPVAKRRPVGTPLSWGEALFAATWVFAILFLAYGVVPHQWLTHADNELAWRSDKILIGPKWGEQNLLMYLPLTITYQVIRDIIAVVIYAVFLGLQIWMWSWWQKRGKKAAATPEIATSSYGRPLVRKG
jgi:hypothetical protein